MIFTALSLLYLLAQALSPTTLFGSLGRMHIEMVLAILLALISVLAAFRSNIAKLPQSLAVVGMAVWVPVSIEINMHWMGGAVHYFLEFIPFVFAYVLVYLYFNSRAKLKFLIVMMVFVCLFVTDRGFQDLRKGESAANVQYVLPGAKFDKQLWDANHPYLLAMRLGEGADAAWIYRLRGQGEINDPNDFGQVSLFTLPLLMLFWRRGKLLSNVVCVLLPSALILFGVFLTQSRGAMLALGVVLLIGARRRIGLIPGLVIAGALFGLAVSGHFTGGRDISVKAGSDRVALWGDGMEMVKASPLVGVGYEQFRQHAPNTAHNSVVVCAAELGFVGLYFWCLFLVPTARNIFVIASSAMVGEQGLSPPRAPQPSAMKRWKTKPLDKAEINQIGQALALSFTAYFVTGWFLSRAFATPLFLLGGMVEVIYQNALDQGMVPPRMPYGRVLRYAFLAMIGLVLIVYLMLRVMNLVR